MPPYFPPPSQSGAVNIKQTEVDFGAIPLKEKMFVVADAEVSASDKITATVSLDDPSDGEPDSAQWFGELEVKAKAGNGDLKLYCASPFADTNGKVKCNYIIG